MKLVGVGCIILLHSKTKADKKNVLPIWGEEVVVVSVGEWRGVAEVKHRLFVLLSLTVM